MQTLVTYIRHHPSMKSAPIEQEDEFRKQFSSGRFSYFDVPTAEPLTSSAKKPPAGLVEEENFDEE